MRPKAERRWPIDPLLETRTRSQLAKAVRASGTTIVAACEEGLTDDQAYAWCDALGLHPWLVWPGLSALAADEATRTCAAEFCEETFVPSRSNHLCCSHRCSKRYSNDKNIDRVRARAREYAKARYWSDPGYREAKIEASRQARKAG